MKTRNKVLLSLLCAVLLVVTSIAGTVAYLTSTKTVTNTFTVGDVEILLDEKNVDHDKYDENGKLSTEATATEPERDQENDYHLLPNTKHTKDPRVTVKAGSEESYVRMILTVHNASAVQAIIDADDTQGDKGAVVDYSDLFGGWQPDKWEYETFTADETANTISFEFRYHITVEGRKLDTEKNEVVDADIILEPLFTEVIVPEYVTNAQLKALYGDPDITDDDFKMVVKAYAIQVEGFDDADEAWNNFPINAN